MDTTPLSLFLREHAERVIDGQADQADTRELLLVLARIVEGKGLYKSFGAPGDWGYGSPIGDAVFDAIKTNPLFR